MKALVACTWLIIAVAQFDASAASLLLIKRIALPKVEGRIDHMAVDVAGQRLFVAALGNNTVEVVDLKGGRVAQSLPGFSEPQGVAYVAELNRLFVANGENGEVRVLDGKSLQIVATVPLGKDADNVRFDAIAQRIYVGYGDGALAILDARSGEKLSDIKLSVHPESFRLESGGSLIFVNVPNADEIAVIDRSKAAIVSKWPMKEAKANFPMILDESGHRLFVGCRKPAKLLVLDSSSGALVASLAISHDADDVFFDAQTKRLYVSCGEGFIDVIEQGASDRYNLRERVQTRAGARTCLLSPELNQLYVALPKHGDQEAEIWIYQPQN